MLCGSRRTSILVVLTLSAALVSASAIADGDWTKPWQAHVSATEVFEFGNADCEPGDAKATLDAAGRASYMGVITDHQTHCINLVTGEFYNGEYTLTDAVGDTLYGTYAGFSVPTVNCPDPVAGDCVFFGFARFTIDGGTGALSTVLGGGGDARIMIHGAAAEVFLGGEIVSQGSLRGEY